MQYKVPFYVPLLSHVFTTLNVFKRDKLSVHNLYTSNLVGAVRFYIHLILSCRWHSFATIWATVCSSWVWINSFTSCRSLLLPEGDTSKRYIELANRMMSRTLIRKFKNIHCFLTIVSVGPPKKNNIMMSKLQHKP
jgi:hypothetical protein